MEPWSPEKRSRMKRKIDKESARAAARLGARSCVIIAFFQDGEYVHMLDGGQSPMPTEKLYKQLASIEQVLDESGGKDVALQ